MASKHNTIMDAMVTLLDTISAGTTPISGGDAYVYTVDAWRTARPAQYVGLPRTLSSGKTACVVVSAGGDKSEILTSCNDQRHTLDIVLLCAVPLEVVSELPWESDPTRATAAANLVADVILCLFSDLKLSGHLLRSITEAVEVDYEIWADKWALAEIRLQAVYQHAKGARA